MWFEISKSQLKKMVVHKRKKRVRLRGSHTHGWGSKKKHRGSGNQGGVGMAGTGKRADQNKPSIWKTDYFGKNGFRFKGVKEEIKPVNIQYLEENIGRILANKLAVKENDTYIIELSKLGYNKLLGNGRVTKKFDITVMYASKGVINKLKAVGGNVKIKV
jgi:large subunit ribosomal protein L15